MTRQGCGHPLSPVPTGAVCYRELSFPTTRKLKGSLLSSEAKKLNHLFGGQLLRFPSLESLRLPQTCALTRPHLLGS